jgi:histone deacetylase 1/2
VSSKFPATIYDACQQGKSHQLLFSESSHAVKHPLELVFSDIWGPAQMSISGHNYYVSSIDAYSRFTWLYLIKRKSDVFDIFIQLQAHTRRETGNGDKVLLSLNMLFSSPKICA